MKFIVHESPVGRGDSDCIARADLAPFGFEGEVEQLWLKRLEDGLFEVCCIPFRVYGISLGDIVALSPDGTTVARVVGKSGRRVLRVFLLETPGFSSVAREFEAEISRLGLLREWSGDRHAAVDVPIGVEVAGIIGLLEREEAASRVFWEWADAASFVASEA
ncbi:DUF4265 domain-containing protein [Amycolatopsis rhabdoformis]|uniref:DUF4265 domain-containing protein n=1 Tax=Amycolatopsis rhabdoformis TaxID=1448059 RepID=A0ABZ1I0T6_9PSEU|nr:DUF4265 domain-containing protein [Amycolatopsis rhabdoformis]WSE27203.1 DUF4265 domain-containing protein [Amycolatopsis rhabdoformis]